MESRRPKDQSGFGALIPLLTLLLACFLPPLPGRVFGVGPEARASGLLPWFEMRSFWGKTVGAAAGLALAGRVYHTLGMVYTHRVILSTHLLFSAGYQR